MAGLAYLVIFFLKFDRLGVIFVSSMFEIWGQFLMKLRSGGLIFKGFGSFFDEIEVWRLTFSRKGVHGRFGWPLGVQHVKRYHAPGRLGPPFWEAFSIKNR